jgi:hypothetical protein
MKIDNIALLLNGSPSNVLMKERIEMFELFKNSHICCTDFLICIFPVYSPTKIINSFKTSRIACSLQLGMKEKWKICYINLPEDSKIIDCKFCIY